MKLITPHPNQLVNLVILTMPYGKYKGCRLCDLPVSYLEWFSRNGFPEGNLGNMLAVMYEIKLNGLEHLLNPLKKNHT